MTSFEKLQRRIGGFPIEYPAAASMAVAVALLTLALPDWRFESAIAATGLPGIVSAAAPPLGTTARVLAALALGALSFLAVWFALRALDAKPQATDFPAFRAADLHPDAPRRRPILAGAEFGAPADEPPPIEEQLGRRRPIIADAMPSFLAPQPPQPEARRPAILPDTLEAPAPADPITMRPARAAPAPDPFADFDEEEFPTEIAAPRPAPRPAETAERVEPVARVEPARVEQAGPRVEAEAPRVEAEVPRGEITPSAVETAKPAPRAVLPGDYDEDEESVSELMARLESGLSERGTRPIPGPTGSAQEELRRALGDLNRVSGRG